MPADSLRNQFLIAMSGLADQNFFQSVTLLCEHNDEGSLGLVINRPTDLDLDSMLEHLNIDTSGLTRSGIPVYWGGPVQTERGFVVHRPAGDWEACMKISDEISVTTSRDILTAIGAGRGPENFLVALGYAGWDCGQLEREILDNSWLNAPASDSIIFELAAEERWSAATRLLGVDPSSLSSTAGHA